MTILWDQNPNAAENYHFALGGQLTTAESAAAVGRALDLSPSEMLVIAGPEVDAQAVCDFTEQLRVERPAVGVIMLRRRLEVTLLAQALRCGVREVVSADDLTALAEASRRSLDLSRRLAGSSGSAVHEGRVVTVFSAKGGVGKTTFSTNLGAYLASTGSRVLLVDLDLAFGDVAISLQILPSRSMNDVVAMAGSLDEQGLASVVTPHSSGLHSVCAPSEPGDADRIPGASVTELLRVARRVYDFVIVDTPPAFSEHVLAAFDVSDVLILLATLDIPAVKNLRLTLDTLDLLGHPKESRVVVLNRSDAKVGLRSDDVVTAIKMPIAVMVPSSTNVPASVNRGVPIVLDEPKHPVSVALRALSDAYIRPPAGEARPAPETTHDHPPQSRRELRFLARGGRR